MHKAQNNKKTVPTVHFVETPAGYYVTIWKEQQPLRRDRSDVGLPRMPNDHRQVLNAYLAGLLELLHRIGLGKARRQIQYGGFGQLWIHDAVASGHRAGKHVPVRID